MADEKPSTLVPKLRFPEFQARSGWPCRLMGQYLRESRITGNKGHEARKLTVKLWGMGVIEKHESVQGSANTQYYRRHAGQFIYSKLDFLNQAFGIIPERLDGFESTVDLPCFDIAPELNAKFLLEYVQREQFYKTRGETAEGGRKAKRIQVDAFLECPIYTPYEPEQQKIADCLGTLDDVIAGEDRKLEALRQHKKGLMQQLFPQEGETLPRLRFPEFQKLGLWKVNPLGEMLKVEYGRDHSKLKEGEHPVYGSGGYIRSVDDYIHDGESVCIGRKGTINKPIFLKGKFWAVDTLFYTHSFKDCLPRFVHLIFLNIPWQTYNAASGVPSLSKTTIERMDAFFPSVSEQQKIADCLGSLDDVIAAQSRKLEALRQHKQGLLQQLFPPLEDH